MEDTTISKSSQSKKDYVPIRIPRSLKRRLNKIQKDTGKLHDTINVEIIQLGIDKYYEQLNTSLN